MSIPERDEARYRVSTFVSDPSSSAPCLYLAAGSGLAPIRALVEAALEGTPPRRIPDVMPGLCSDLARRDVFVAGAPGFVGACAVAAEALGAPGEHVHTERFFVEP